MKRQTKAQKVIDARIQNAVCGFSIPMMSITALYKQMEAAIALGATDEDLKAIVACFPGVQSQHVAQRASAFTTSIKTTVPYASRARMESG